MAEDNLSAGTEAGSVDAAAAEIAKLLAGPQGPAEPDQEPVQPTPDTAEAEPVEDTNSSEEAALAETPAVASEDAPTPQAKPQAQQPVIPATQAQPQQPSATSTVQSQLSQLNQAIPVMQAQLAQAFPEVKTADDLVKLASEDPARAVAYSAMRDKLNGFVALQQQTQAAYKNEYVATEQAKLHSLIPDLADKEKGPAIQAKLLARAREAGYSDSQIEWASASDVHLLYQAMQFQEMQLTRAAEEKAKAAAITQAKAKAAKAPPVQQPGVQRPNASRDEKAREGMDRLRKTGSVDDAAAVFRQII